MSLRPLVGHRSLRESLTRAVHAGSLPGSLLFQGAPGVGKQRLALWLGALLLCEHPGEEGPCGECRACRQVDRLEHPDLHWYFPLPRPKGVHGPERLGQALEDARWEALSEIRSNPLKVDHDVEPRGLYLALVQGLRKKAIQRPSAGDRQVFVIGQAESLVPQESSPEAANALLKLLEEPPPGTTFILTTSRPRDVLPTIRSRTLPVHMPPLPESLVRDFLVEELGAGEEDANRAAALSGGSIGRALGFLPSHGDEPAPLDQVRRDAYRLFRTALAPGRAPRFATALDHRPSGARTLLPLLDALETWIRDSAAILSGSEASIENVDAGEALKAMIGESGLHPTQLSRCLDAVDRAREEASGNVNPQLVIFGLTTRLGAHLASPTPAHAGDRT
jgi:DNA polymerase-3 subunit delta'